MTTSRPPVGHCPRPIAHSARPAPRGGPSGQVLVIVALGMIAIIAMVGLVIDGGYAWGRQRDTQNGADALAKAGTGVVQHYLAGVDASTDRDVGCAVARAAQANSVKLEGAIYTDYRGQALSPGVAVGPCGPTDPGTHIPTGAQGVKATASETYTPFLMQILGFDHVTATADATAVVGTLTALPGGALPVTFPQVGAICDSTNATTEVRADNGDGVWQPYEIIDEANANASNLAILPLCDTGPGSVGWLDFGCGQNLSSSITKPCDIQIPIPAWLHTQTGNVNSLETELNAYAGPTLGVAEPSDAVLAVPIFDNTCSKKPANNDPTCQPLDAEWSGNGNNLYYHVPFWVGFKLDRAYVQGGDKECTQSPGKPVLNNPQPKGKVGCLKGWFVDRFDSPGPIGLGPITRGAQVPMAITLIE